MRQIITDGKVEKEFLAEIRSREVESDRKVTVQVLDIIENVRTKGDAALKEYGLAFDKVFPESLEVPREVLKEAWDNADEKLRSALEFAKDQIESYHKMQVQEGCCLEREGLITGQKIRGLKRVGLYVPGGRAAYPSTVLMNAIPAKLAGVGELLMVTPPLITKNEDGTLVCKANPDIMAAAYLCGVDRVFLTGGAQAVAALAYGTETIPAVDKIVGPGNIYVATAKKLVFGKVDIDMVAGPSEILIIADKTANPAYVAADLLSQAEHDPLAASILLTTDPELPAAVLAEIDRQMSYLGRKETIQASLNNNGAIILCKTEEEMVELADGIAPEHLELLTEDPVKLLDSIENAGSVFCGPYAPEPLGDYCGGPNHVLPTSGTARYASPLGVYSFIKRMSYTIADKSGLDRCRSTVLELAEREGLGAHGNAIRVRFE
ncbi:MAG: histidinol dehydrogenase [Clostridiales bacterium]|nr:histidinol dehydrogenase [Clostridiales bacterium]